MGTVEDFERALQWRAAWRRAQEREPEVVAAFAALAEEVGLRQADDRRSECAAITQAIATEGGRQAVAAFRDALVRAETEISSELRGEPPTDRIRPALHLEEPEVEDHPPAAPPPRPKPSPKEDRGEAPKPAPPPPPPIESGPPPFSPLRRSSGWTSL